MRYLQFEQHYGILKSFAYNGLKKHKLKNNPNRQENEYGTVNKVNTIYVIFEK